MRCKVPSFQEGAFGMWFLNGIVSLDTSIKVCRDSAAPPKAQRTAFDTRGDTCIRRQKRSISSNLHLHLHPRRKAEGRRQKAALCRPHPRPRPRLLTLHRIWLAVSRRLREPFQSFQCTVQALGPTESLRQSASSPLPSQLPLKSISHSYLPKLRLLQHTTLDILCCLYRNVVEKALEAD